MDFPRFAARFIFCLNLFIVCTKGQGNTSDSCSEFWELSNVTSRPGIPGLKSDNFKSKWVSFPYSWSYPHDPVQG